MARLDDPWFEATFYGDVSAEAFHFLDSIEGAQGVWLWCPGGYGKPEYPLLGPRPHALMIPFQNPRNAPLCPSTHGPVSRTGSRPGEIAELRETSAVHEQRIGEFESRTGASTGSFNALAAESTGQHKAVR